MKVKVQEIKSASVEMSLVLARAITDFSGPIIKERIEGILSDYDESCHSCEDGSYNPIEVELLDSLRSMSGTRIRHVCGTKCGLVEKVKHAIALSTEIKRVTQLYVSKVGAEQANGFKVTNVDISVSVDLVGEDLEIFEFVLALIVNFGKNLGFDNQVIELATELAEEF